MGGGAYRTQALDSPAVAADRLSAEGYGAEHPIADTSTEEGRARNRRIALRVDARSTGRCVPVS
jgi:outer membrane protein OmpA-like peptidoglycan-associated protein